MKPAEKGGYINLLLHQWDKGFIPDTLEEQMEVAEIKGKELEKVLKKFPKCEDGLLKNAKLEKVRADVAKLYSRNRANGANGGRPSKKESKPKNNPQETHGLNVGNPQETQTKPSGGEIQNQIKIQNQNQTTADAVGPAAQTFSDPKNRLHPLAVENVAMQLMYYREDLPKEQAVIEARVMLDKVSNPGPGYIGEWAKNVKIKPEAGRSVIMDFMGSQVTWTEEEYQQYCNNPAASGYSFVKYV